MRPQRGCIFGEAFGQSVHRQRSPQRHVGTFQMPLQDVHHHLAAARLGHLHHVVCVAVEQQRCHCGQSCERDPQMMCVQFHAIHDRPTRPHFTQYFLGLGRLKGQIANGDEPFSDQFDVVNSFPNGAHNFPKILIFDTSPKHFGQMRVTIGGQRTDAHDVFGVFAILTSPLIART